MEVVQCIDELKLMRTSASARTVLSGRLMTRRGSQLQVEGFWLSTCGKAAMWLRTITITWKYMSIFNTRQILEFDLFLCSFNLQINKK